MMISVFQKNDGDNFSSLIDMYQKQQEDDGFRKKVNLSYSKASRSINVSKNLLHGNMREMRKQVIANFTNINRKFREYDGCSLVHLCCQEGYPEMLNFLLEWEEVDIKDIGVKVEVNNKNEKGRTPLMLCFTPPIMTYLGQTYGKFRWLHTAYRVPVIT